MNRVLLSITVSALLLNMAQADEKLEDITVITTATKTEKNIEGVSASVVVIGEKRIKEMGATQLGDIINKTPGIIRQFGTFPSASAKSKSSISIRGMGSTNTLFLIDGKRLSGEVSNPYDLDRIPASTIERVEIVKGAMSSLYGADAVGGVINIITKKPTEAFEGTLGLKYGANSEGDGANSDMNLNVRGSQGKLRYSVYGSKMNSTPYTQTERTQPRLGGGKKRQEELRGVPLPGYLTPGKKTPNGTPFYLQPDKTVAPKYVASNGSDASADREVGVDEFNRFKDDILNSSMKEHYDTAVTYREKADIINVGTRLEYDVTDNIVAGVDLSYMKEERNGVYNATAHPFGFKPPVGHAKNPIVGHHPNGTPIGFVEAKGHPKGMCPAWNVPVNSHDENIRRNIGADIKWMASDDLALDFKVYNSFYEKRNTTTMKHYKDFGFPNEAKSGANGMNADVDITSYEIMANYAISDEHLLTVGAEHRDEKRDSSVFTKTNTMTRESVDYQALYVQDEWEVSDTLNVIAGGRYDAISNAENKPTFRLGAVKNLDGGVNLRANFAQAYRTPDIREMYINKQTPAGLMVGASHANYNLEPEFTNAYEVAVGGKKNGFDYDVALFLNQIEDRIEQVQGDNSSSFTFKNVSEAETKGIEARVGYMAKSGLYAGLSMNEMRTENKDTGKSLEFTPNRTISANIDIPLSKALKVGFLTTYIGEQEYADMKMKKVNNKPTKVKVDKITDAYTLVDMTASYTFGNKMQYRINGGVNNIFDEKVDNRLGSNVGTYAFVGASMDF
ncbi:MAG: TonB-dependent receptor [Sulfurovaceae bacterium]|nr:TonB-dependent receptor [Sulfurovaceae bacterium]